MSAVQAGSGKGSGQKPGSAAGGRPGGGAKPSPGRSASTAGKTPGRRPGPATKPTSGNGKGGASKAGAARTSQYRPGVKPPQRFSASTMAFAAVAVVVVIIVAFVAIKIGGGSSKPSTNATQAPKDVAATPAVVDKVTSEPASVAAKVGLPSTSTVAPPTLKAGQPALTSNGKPEALFIGGEFCPLCAAERWAMIMAFSKFGTFSGLKETTSSPWDSDPSTATFSFLGSSYSSPYISFVSVEHESNDSSGLGTRTVLQPLTSQQSNLWAKYDTPQEGFPFLDIANKYFVLNPSYNPAVLGGLDQVDIASKLKNANDPVTQSIVGTSTYLTAAICAVTGQKPASVCSAPVVGRALHAINGN